MNNFEQDLPDTAARTQSELLLQNVREQGGFFVDAVRLTRMPMIVTDATLPGNPIIFANPAFIELSGYSLDELTGQEPHFMNGGGTDPKAIRTYQAAMHEGHDETLEIVQYKKDGSPFRAMLFASPLDDGQGKVLNHFMSYLDISRRFEAEESLRALNHQLESKVAARTAELERANATLTRLLGEKEMLLAEVNHRAKNSLSIASALLEIQGRRQTDPEIQALFQEAQDRIMSMARVHDLLSRSEKSQRVDLATYFNDLCEALRPITLHDDCVKLVANVDADILVHAETAIPLGIVATELITNSVKYAFPSPECGTISVIASRRGETDVEIVIADDGRGMGTPREGSLGHALVNSLVRKIDGKMIMSGENGVRVAITFPCPQLDPAATALADA